MSIRIGKLYLAYGSNMNQEQMKQRCPTAELKGKALLKGYRLCFKGIPLNGVATIEPDEQSSVPVLIWLIYEKDEDYLDLYEGYPRLYRKETLEVDWLGEPTKIMAYIMNSEMFCNAMPATAYYQTIAQGYKDAGFDLNILRDAALSASKMTFFEQEQNYE